MRPAPLRLDFPPLAHGALLLTLGALLDPPLAVGLAVAALLLLARRAAFAAAAFWVAGIALGASATPAPPGKRPYAGALRVRADSRPSRYGALSTWVELQSPPTGLAADARWIERDAVEHRTGDWFLVSGTLELPEPPRNPGERPSTARLTTTHAVLLRDVWRTGQAPLAMTWGALRRGADRIAALLERGLARLPSPSAAALARALALGRAERLAEPLRQALLDCGGWHLIAVSGSHVMLLAALLEPLLPRRRRRARSVVLLGTIATYVLLCGAQPPVVRAGLGYGLFHLARHLGEPAGGPRLLAAIYLLLVAATPDALADVGLQLSFTAVFALEVAARYGPSRSPRGSGHGIDWRRPLGRALRSACFAAVATAPLTAFHFGSVTWIAPLATLLLAPLVTIGLCASLVTAALAGTLHALSVAPAAAGSRLLLAPLDLLLSGLDHAIGGVAAALAAAPATPLLSAAPSVAWSAGVLLFWYALAVRRPAVALAIAAVLTSAATWPLGARIVAALRPTTAPSDAAAGNARASLTLLDVGHGQAALLCDGTRAWLFDAGGSRAPDGRALLRSLVELTVPRLDALVLSHLDADHCRYAIELLDRWPIVSLVLSPAAAAELAAPVELHVELLAAAIERRAIVPRVVVAGDQIGPHAVVWPPAERRFAARNAGSIAVIAAVGETRVLLPGDLEGPPLIDFATALAGRVDLVVLPHHGGEDDGLPWLLEQCGASHALLSRAEAELPLATVRALERARVPWNSTSRGGALTFEPPTTVRPYFARHR